MALAVPEKKSDQKNCISKTFSLSNFGQFIKPSAKKGDEGLHKLLDAVSPPLSWDFIFLDFSGHMWGMCVCAYWQKIEIYEKIFPLTFLLSHHSTYFIDLGAVPQEITRMSPSMMG